MEITRFRGEYNWLSNLYLVEVGLETTERELIWFPSVEHAYQAAKTTNQADWGRIISMTAKQAKSYGKKVTLRDDWETFKLTLMKELIRKKFMYEDLADKLLATGADHIVEGNTWGDTYWGVSNGVGENHLGKILMEVRDEL